MLNNEIKLIVDGKIYSGWKSVYLSQSLSTLSGSFDLSLSAPFDAQESLNDLSDGQSCQIRIGEKQVVLTGFIDEISKSFDSQSKTIRITGRDRVADLVDCSAKRFPSTWKEVCFEKIAEDLLKNFKIPLKCEVNTGQSFPIWQIQESESVFECLNRAAKLRNLLLITDGEGALVITRPKREGVINYLKEGTNIISANYSKNSSKKFSLYCVVAHVRGAVSNLSDYFILREELEDSSVNRYRPLMISAESTTTLQSAAKERTEWERTTRAAASETLSVTVAGWLTDAKTIWKLNSLVHVESREFNLNEPFLISSLSFSLDESGKRTTLGLQKSTALLGDPTLRFKENPYIGKIEQGMK